MFYYMFLSHAKSLSQVCGTRSGTMASFSLNDAPAIGAELLVKGRGAGACVPLGLPLLMKTTTS